MKRLVIRMGVALTLAGSVAGCTGDAATSASRPTTLQSSEPLRIAAASDLQEVLPTLIVEFRRQVQQLGLTIEPTFGASGQLARQMRQGAPFDLFLSADRQYPEELAASGAIEPTTIRPYARGTLVLVVMAGGSTPEVKKLEDLEAPEFRKIALANPQLAPYGRAAQQALERAGLADRLSSRLVLAPNVRDTLRYLQSGNVDAAFLPRSLGQEPGVRDTGVELSTLTDPVVQTLGVAADSPQSEMARQFADFLLGKQAQAILSHHRFLPP
jgi:molybdate transport system substrate-binding protein